MTPNEFESIFSQTSRWQKVALYFLSRFAITCAGRVTMAVVMLAAFALSGCSSIPSVQACRVAKYERTGDTWNAELRECRVMASPIPGGI